MDFLKFYVDKKFFSKNRPGHVESYIKGDSNTYISDYYLPWFFFLGIAVFSVYLIALTFLSFYAYKKTIFSAPSINDVFQIEKGKCRVCLTSDNLIKDRLFSHFKAKKNFLYFCNPDQIPSDYNVKYFLDFIHGLLKMPVNYYGIDNPNQCFKSLDINSKLQILSFLFALDFDFFIFNSPESNESIDAMANSVNNLKNESKSILYITNNLTLAAKIFDGDYIIPNTTNSFQF